MYNSQANGKFITSAQNVRIRDENCKEWTEKATLVEPAGSLRSLQCTASWWKNSKKK